MDLKIYLSFCTLKFKLNAPTMFVFWETVEQKRKHQGYTNVKIFVGSIYFLKKSSKLEFKMNALITSHVKKHRNSKNKRECWTG